MKSAKIERRIVIRIVETYWRIVIMDLHKLVKDGRLQVNKITLNELDKLYRAHYKEQIEFIEKCMEDFPNDALSKTQR
jgi:hypothetical protein